MNPDQMSSMVLEHTKKIEALKGSMKTAFNRLDKTDKLTEAVHTLAQSNTSLATEVKMMASKFDKAIDRIEAGQQRQGERLGNIEKDVTHSSGHGLHIPGARDLIDEVTEARRVTDRVAEILRGAGVNVNVFHDDTTRPPNSTVNTINNHHNAQTRDLDVSVHFNAVAGGTRDAGIGVETLYREGNAEMRDLASRISKAISQVSGLDPAPGRWHMGAY